MARRYAASRREWFARVLELLRPRVRKLDQLVEDGRPFFEERVTFDDAAVKKHLGAPGMRAHLNALASRIRDAASFDQASLDALLRATAEERGLKPAR